jgi:HK97 gp10 family phage protein
MEILYDLTGLRNLEANLVRLPFQLQERTMQAALSEAAKPIKTRMVQEAPRGKGNQRVSLKRRSNDYRRGGATRQDIRIRAVRDKVGEAKVIIGVSKKSGKVGWRTHFITKGVAGKRRIRPNDFLTRAFSQTIAQVTASLGQTIEKKVLAAMKRLGLIP